MMIGRRQPEIGKDVVGHRRVIMLSGVDDRRRKVGRGGQRVPERRDLHEIGSGSGDQVNTGNSSHEWKFPK
jgi:hypothetical protein